MCLGFMRFAVLVAFLCGVLALQNTTRHVVLKPGKPALFHKNGNASHAHAHHPPHAGEAPLERHRPPHDAKAGGAPHHALHAARAVVENVSLHEGAEWRLPHARHNGTLPHKEHGKDAHPPPAHKDGAHPPHAHKAGAHPPHAHRPAAVVSSGVRGLALAGAVATALIAEEILLGGLPEISVKVAVAWLVCFVLYCAVLLVVVGAWDGWDAPPRYASVILLNAALSPDNLVVFMMFLKSAQLPARHHRRVISDGFLFAIALRLGTMIATSALLEAFSPLRLILALVVFLKGLQMVVDGWRAADAPADGPEAPPQDAADHWAVKALARVVPVSWSDDSDGVCILRNAGRFYVTRTTALIFAIGWCDLTFSSDNITAILALTTDAFTITATMTLSILALRPVYFLCFAFVDYLDALDSALGVILVVIGGKLLLGLAGVEVPLWAVVLVLTVWRIGVAAYVFNKARSRV